MEARGPVLNPLAHLDTLGPQQKKLGRGGQALIRRRAQFEAQRAREESMAMQMEDLNPVEHQTKATFTPKKSLVSSQPPPRPIAPRPADARVQRVRPMEAPEPSAFENDLMNELEADFGAEATAAPATEPSTSPESETDVDAILKRYKGSPDEVARQVAKSYAESKKRMQQLEAEKQLFLKQGTQPQPAPHAAPVPQQIQVQPAFNYKRFKDDMLDRGDEVAKEFEQHVTNTLDQRLASVVTPLFEEAIDNRLFRKFGDVVTEDNLDLIKAMAQTEPGTNRWEKMVSAVTKYKTSMPGITHSQLPEVAEMQRQAAMPSPQARTGGEKKMYKQSDLQSIMQKKMKTGEWQRDPKWSNLVNAAYRDGRVLRGQ